MANSPITESEVSKATKLAERKSGATRADVAGALKVSTSRAGKILDRVPGIKSAKAGADAGRASHRLIYTTK